MSKYEDYINNFRASMAVMPDPMKEHREMMASIADPMKDLRASMAVMPDPMKEHRELMASIADPMKDLRTSMAVMLDPMKEHRELMASISNPMKDFRASMALMSDPMKEHREMMASISNPMKDLRASMAVMLDPMKEHRELMASISNPMKDFRASMALMSDPMKDLRTSLTRMSNPFIEIQKTIATNVSLKSIREIAFEIQPNIEIDSQGTVILATKRITAAELQELSDKIFDNSSLAKTNSLEESINNLVNEIQKQKDPLSQKILIYFIYPLIIIVIASFLNPIVDYNVKSYLNSNKRTLAKELKANVNLVIDDKNLLLSLRYVSADILNVRASASAKAKSIGYLYFSSTVLIIEKRKNWTLIEWHDPETDAKITGWVFSRYLAKFR